MLQEELRQTTTITVRLLPVVKEWLYNYAKEHGVSASEMVRQILDEYRELIAD